MHRRQSGSDQVMNTIAGFAGNGTIGYVEYSYPLNKGFPVVKVLNKAGFYIEPTQYNVAVALTQAQINNDPTSPNYLTQILDGVYANHRPADLPAVVLLLHDHPDRAPTTPRMTTAKRQTLVDFMYYSLCEGQAKAGPFGYSPLPLNLVQAGFDQVTKLKRRRPGGRRSSNRDVTNCNNPTFVAGDLSQNHLAEIAPLPGRVRPARRGPVRHRHRHRPAVDRRDRPATRRRRAPTARREVGARRRQGRRRRRPPGGDGRRRRRRTAAARSTAGAGRPRDRRGRGAARRRRARLGDAVYANPTELAATGRRTAARSAALAVARAARARARPRRLRRGAGAPAAGRRPMRRALARGRRPSPRRSSSRRGARRGRSAAEPGARGRRTTAATATKTIDAGLHRPGRVDVDSRHGHRDRRPHPGPARPRARRSRWTGAQPTGGRASNPYGERRPAAGVPRRDPAVPRRRRPDAARRGAARARDVLDRRR